MVNLIKFCNPKSIQISIHMQMYILQLSCHQETLLLDSLNLISISDYSFHFQSISKILSQKFSSNRHTSCMYPLSNPGFFLGNRQYVQFNLLCLECLVSLVQHHHQFQQFAFLDQQKLFFWRISCTFLASHLCHLSYHQVICILAKIISNVVLILKARNILFQNSLVRLRENFLEFYLFLKLVSAILHYF